MKNKWLQQWQSSSVNKNESRPDIFNIEDIRKSIPSHAQIFIQFFFFLCFAHIVTVANTVSDPVIEEHFRRSLGKNYKDAEPVSNSVSITGSVDDHFAKALGDAWLQIKAKGGGHQSSESDSWGRGAGKCSRHFLSVISHRRFLTSTHFPLQRTTPDTRHSHVMFFCGAHVHIFCHC